MILWAFLLLSLAFCPVSPMPSSTVTDVDEEWKDIPDINKGLHLKEGDIMVSRQRSSVLDKQLRWEIPVPYVLSADLSMDSRGVILRAFEQFRLKSCIDFKLRTTEDFYISVEKREGCWSYIGRVSPGQSLSIGNGCGIIGIVEHEFLHALGFFHEQSRYDRDDYVTIKFENILSGYERNFDKYSENTTSIQGTPYDYTSVMHYNKNTFSNGNGSTIVTRRPEFENVIGQRLDMSEYDAVELNTLYKCNSSTSFLDHCSFDDESQCKMSVCSTSEHGWQRVSSVSDVNVTDHTYCSNGTSFFMHFNAVGRKEGDSARLESREMTPTRNCKVQCLQFYYYHSANENDQLNIWIREYRDAADSRGTLRLMGQITGRPNKYWQLHHVPLNANKTFQVLFETSKGAGNSSGGFSLDDINISQTECPHIWQIRDFEKLMNDTPTGSEIYSPLYYSSDGYRYQVFLRNDVTYFSTYVRLVSGEFDDQLQWPCPWRQVTFQVLDQNPHMQRRMSYEKSITTDPTLVTEGGTYFWNNPRINGTQTIIGNESVFVTSGWGNQYFMYKDELPKRDFLKGGDIIFLFSMQDLSWLLQNKSVPCPNVKVKHMNATVNESVSQGPCVLRALTTPQPIITTLPGPIDHDCLDIFCCSSSKTLRSSLILLVVLFLLLLN
ncbi:meprin A subunit beta-like isoform X2 [Triplophysa rosa]|uniref:Metalloendopeptidase n=1 Tax=Triplophysa rosa TaxID=992332 RepID=A0A9W7T3M4_TRIRA|nr:meprin A subunit beta-like isoform X2 [Triplophysa rosa]KAI7789686.1 putative meprin A subunit beta-like [Triplophysa rosa]